MFLQENLTQNNTFYDEDNENSPHGASGQDVIKVAIKVANFDWSVIMIITTLFLCILYVCGFALLCLKAISSLGDNAANGSEQLLPTEAGTHHNINVNFGNIHNQISNSSNQPRTSNSPLILEWQLSGISPGIT